MVPDCVQDVDVNGHKFRIEIKDNYAELYAGAVVDSRYTCVYFGPPGKLDSELKEAITKSHAPVLSRKCKTVLLIYLVLLPAPV